MAGPESNGLLEGPRSTARREPLQVTVITTLWNEAHTVRPLLDSLLHQARPPAEIVVADAGSSDDTADIVRAYAEQGAPVRLLVIPGTNRAQGRNAAVRAASHDIIASIDGGCQAAPQWLEEITRPMLLDPEIIAVAGHTHAEAHSAFEAVSAALFYSDPPSMERWLPASRSIAFRRSAWQEAGGYPEDMRRHEDTLFALSLRRLGQPLAVAPYAIVHWRPRRNLGQLFRQFFGYARGDGQGRVFATYYGRKALWYLSGLALMIGGSRYWPLWALLVLTMAVFLARRMRPVFRLVPYSTGRMQAPSQIITADIASIAGYLVGLLEGEAPERPSPVP